MKNQFFIIALIALISSCTVVKRVHQTGYYVSWHKQHKTIPSSDEQSLVQQLKEPIIVPINEIVSEQLLPNSEVAQVVENTDEVTNVSSVESTSEVVSTKTTTPEVETSKIVAKKTIKVFENGKDEKSKATSSADSGSGKSQLVALILCILLGLIGVHRFYLGYTGLGILYLLTFGLFGVGWLIDLILLIIPNGLSPKGRSSYRK